MKEIVFNFALQVIIGLGTIVVFTLLLYLCSKFYLSKTGNAGVIVNRVTGVIGTPVHELSHALFCILFGHKIQAIKLFQISDDGTMGYVEHTYNPKNLYHRIDNFFIGIAPIFGGAAVIYLIMRFCLPNTFISIKEELNFVYLLDVNLFDLHFYGNFFDIIKSIFEIIYDFSNFSNVLWWISMLIMICVSMHMLLSVADIKGSLAGLASFLILLLVLDIVGYFVGFLHNISYFLIMFLSMLLPILCIAFVFSMIQVLCAFIYSKVKKGGKI